MYGLFGIKEIRRNKVKWSVINNIRTMKWEATTTGVKCGYISGNLVKQVVEVRKYGCVEEKLGILGVKEKEMGR